MTVQQLIEELLKLPPAARQQDVAVQSTYGGRGLEVRGVSFQGNHTQLLVKE